VRSPGGVSSLLPPQGHVTGCRGDPPGLVPLFGDCNVLSLLWSFRTVSVRIGALAQYDFLYGLIYRIFLVFLGLFPVGFRLFG
jgi:hypothetical protein